MTAVQASKASTWLNPVVVLFAVHILMVVVMIANEAVGSATFVQGVLDENCVHRGAKFQCTAKLDDGSYQIFQYDQPLQIGTPITFDRRERKYVGRSYELAKTGQARQ